MTGYVSPGFLPGQRAPRLLTRNDFCPLPAVQAFNELKRYSEGERYFEEAHLSQTSQPVGPFGLYPPSPRRERCSKNKKGVHTNELGKSRTRLRNAWESLRMGDPSPLVPFL